MSLVAYLPQDRCRALASGESLPDRTSGSALFADISGFTSLTETLCESLGTRRGVEALTQRINAVYDALIDCVERYDGSVVNFAGDSITCWFDEREANHSASQRAVAAAVAMQQTMPARSELSVKVIVTSGPARRFALGDPAIQLIDILAGATIARLTMAENLIHQGETLADAQTVARCEGLEIGEWRTNGETQDRFALVTGLPLPSPNPPHRIHIDNLPAETWRAWVLPNTYARASNGESSFLTELRPCTALFVRFTGINYDTDEAEQQLDNLIRHMQTVVARYDGALLQLTVGDKGSFAYLNLGAISTHEDDSIRAIKAAWELKNTHALPMQIGIAQGVMRVGAYGGSTRMTFGVIGDDTNLAARLMMTAETGEILVSSRVQKQVERYFVFEPRPPLSLKGKAEPVPVFAVTGERRQRAVRLQEPTYALPMVGRQRELQIIEEKLNLVLGGQSQVIGIVAEAGLGKSRLVAEAIRLAHRKGFVGYGGTCPSDGIHIPYLVWKSVWSAFFSVDPELPTRKQIRYLAGELEDRAPLHLDSLPLLGTLLDLNLPENDFTRGLDPKIRQSALHALLESCLKAAAKENPLILVLEDLHWIDALSNTLLDELSAVAAHSPICFVLAYRPRLPTSRMETLPQFTRIELHELNTAEAEQAIRAKLTQLYPARSGAVLPSLVDTLMARAQGNPFYLEELLNYLHDRGLDPRDPTDLAKIELPDSLHALILSRIDELSEREKITLRVASIIGRQFRAVWLMGYYPQLGELSQVKQDLDQLDALDITPLDTPEPELAYLFKHIVTHEVTYESLPFDTRARLHEQLACFLELRYPDAPPLEVLAFHYGHSNNKEKQREYLYRAGQAAQKKFANAAALAYYGQVLPLLDDGKEKATVYLQRGTILELMGEWASAEADYRSALDEAQQQQDTMGTAGAQFALGKLYCRRGNYDTALGWLEQARAGRAALEDRRGLSHVLAEMGHVITYQGDYAQAREMLNASLALARQVNDQAGISESLILLGNVAQCQGDFSAARALFEECLALRRVSNDKWGMANALSNLGDVALVQRDYHTSRALYAESLSLRREVGAKRGITVSLYGLGSVALALGDYSEARTIYEESLRQSQQMNDKSIMAYIWLGLGLVILASPHQTPALISEARQHIITSLHLRQEIAEPLLLVSSLIGIAMLNLHEGDARRAAQLLGAATASLQSLKATVEFDMHHVYDQTLTATSAVLSEDDFQSAWTAGTKLSLTEAVQLALERGD